MQKLKKYKLWYSIFLVVGIIGITNIASYFILSANYYTSIIGSMGYLEFIHLYILDTFFWGGSEVTRLMSFFVFISSLLVSLVNLSIIWLVLAFVFKRKVKAIESPTEENIKKLKHLPAISVVAVATIILFLIVVFVVRFE